MKSFTKKSLSILALSLTGAVACGSFVGCGGDDDDTTGPGTDAGGKLDGSTGGDSGGKTDSGPGTDSGPTDGGPGNDAADTGPIDAGPQYIRRGSVSLTSTKAVTYGASASASFTNTVGVTSIPGYVTTVLDSACTLTVYTPPAPVDAGDAGDAGDADAGTPPSAPEAATITISDTTKALPATVTLSPTAGTGLYTPYTSGTTTSTTEWFAGGDSISFSAAGDTNSVGAFSTTVTAPADIAVTAPAISTLGQVTGGFPRGSDLAVTWTGGQLNTFVTVSLSSTNSTSKVTKTLSCKFAAGGGTGTVPTADLQQLDEVTSSNGNSGTLFITPVNSTTTWAAVDGADAGENPDAGNQDYLVTTAVSGDYTFATYTNTN